MRAWLARPLATRPLRRNYNSSVKHEAKKPKGAHQAPPLNVDLSVFPPERVRNFCIVAHIDHGKTTLSTRLLEETGVIDPEGKDRVFLDKLRVEKERGITVKAQSASMFYSYKGITYLLNLIDTPGHVDFSYEVSRSLKACEGAVLLVDAMKGIQAQTMANFWLAFEADLQIIPVINKVDMKNANVVAVQQQMREVFDVMPASTLMMSGKTGLGVPELLGAIVERIKPPTVKEDAPFRWFGTDWTGVVCLLKVVDGAVSVGDTVRLFSTKETYVVTDLGVMHPEMRSVDTLRGGQVGYMTCGMKTTKEARVGDTVYNVDSPVEPFSGFQVPQPMVFGGVYPNSNDEYNDLKDAIEKLALTDPAVQILPESNDILGLGFRCGFLGLLHMEVFSQRLQQEYGAHVITTAPTVAYRVRATKDGEYETVSNPADWPEDGQINSTQEPVVRATIVVPKEYMGPIMKLCNEKRGHQESVAFIDETRVVLRYILPLGEIIVKFYDQLKSHSSGFATFDYEDGGYREADLVKVSMMLNGVPVGSLSIICHRDRAHTQGKLLALKLKEVIKRQQFDVAIQAAIGKRVIARETIKQYRKDVTAKCYGGDITRKRKLLEKQKEGKKKMKQIGSVEVPHEAFIAVMKL